MVIRGLKWSSFSKISKISSKLIKFDEKDVNNTSVNQKTNPPITNEVFSLDADMTDNNNDASYNSNKTSLDIENYNHIKNVDLKVEQNNKQQVNFLNSNEQCLYKCYYCDKFSLINNEEEYLKHVVLNHNNKPAYPSIADLDKNNLKPQGKSWEI